MDRAEVGVIHGRFQPVHVGHMEYLLAGKSRCKYLWIGIANPDPGLTAYDPVNPNRSEPSSNPFLYYERFLMIRDAFLDAEVPRDEFDIVPFPINFPELLKYYVPLNARFFVTVYDEWGWKKVDLFRSLGLDVDVMWVRSPSDLITSGTEIRNLILTGGDWDDLVPSTVAKIIHDVGTRTIASRMNVE